MRAQGVGSCAGRCPPAEQPGGSTILLRFGLSGPTCRAAPGSVLSATRSQNSALPPPHTAGHTRGTDDSDGRGQVTGWVSWLAGCEWASGLSSRSRHRDGMGTPTRCHFFGSSSDGACAASVQCYREGRGGVLLDSKSWPIGDFGPSNSAKASTIGPRSTLSSTDCSSRNGSRR